MTDLRFFRLPCATLLAMTRNPFSSVILAQARIHFQAKVKMDSGLRRNDGPHPSPRLFLRLLGFSFASFALKL
jgi:hypothetical protein